METKDKELLLKDLCTRLPYRVKVCYKYDILMGETTEELKPSLIEKFYNFSGELFQLKPHLRPMSSMTEEECYKLASIHSSFTDTWKYIKAPIPLAIANYEQVDWLNAHHFDYLGLISMGLALPATEGMYNL